MALVSMIGAKMLTSKSKIPVKAKTTVKVIINLYLVDSSMGRNIRVYPIRVPTHATGHQKRVLVYAAQVKRSRQTDR